MRLGTAPFLACALAAGSGLPALSQTNSPAKPPGKFPRGPYILREIFGDLPQSRPAIWGTVPGIQRQEISPGLDLGQEIRSADAPSSSVREISGRATVTFVFEGREAASRLDHVTVAVFESPGVTRKSVYTHLSKIYGPPDPGAEKESGETASWLQGSVVMRHFAASRFFEVTLSIPRPSS